MAMATWCTHDPEPRTARRVATLAAAAVIAAASTSGAISAPDNARQQESAAFYVAELRAAAQHANAIGIGATQIRRIADQSARRLFLRRAADGPIHVPVDIAREALRRVQAALKEAGR